jgi:hypothetical protein
MAFTIAQVNVAANATMQILIDQVNKAINAISNFVVTVDTSANGALNTGSVYPNKIFLGNSTVNSIINSSSIQTNTANLVNLIIGNVLANTTVFQVGANIAANTTVLKVGNVSINTSMVIVGGSNVSTISNRMSVAKANTLIGERPRLNLIEGNNISLSVVDDSNTGQVSVTVTAGITANAAPGGNDSDIQFNDGGNLAGDDNLQWNKTNLILQSSNGIVAQNYMTVNCVSIDPTIVTLTSNTLQNIDTFFLANFRTCEYTLSVRDNSSNNYQASKILMVHDGTNVIMTEYAQLFTNTQVCTFSVFSNSTVAMLQADPITSSNVNIKIHRQLIGI